MYCGGDGDGSGDSAANRLLPSPASCGRFQIMCTPNVLAGLLSLHFNCMLPA